MLKFAHHSQFISHMPFENIKPLKKDKNEPDPLLTEEYNALISALSKFHARIWRIAVFTGMRHGELCALAWEDVDLEAGTVPVKRNISNKGLFGPPKTAAGVRTITLLQPALEALREQFELTGAMKETQITFHHREIGKNEQQSLRFVFRPKAQSKSKAVFIHLAPLPTAGGVALNYQGYVNAIHISHDIPMHAGLYQQGQTHRL